MEQCCPLATVEPESQACSTNVAHSMPRGSISERGYSTKSGQNQRGGEKRGEASVTCRGVVSGPRAPVLGKNTWNFFFVLYVARVVFYQCSPYFEDFGGEGGAHIGCWSEVATEHRVVIGECHWLITKHDPVIKSEFAELADIGRLTRHHRFLNFPLQDAG